MENKVSEVILEHIDKSEYEEPMKDFLKEILNFELQYQIRYEESGQEGKHHYSEKYMSLIKDSLGD